MEERKVTFLLSVFYRAGLVETELRRIARHHYLSGSDDEIEEAIHRYHAKMQSKQDKAD